MSLVRNAKILLAINPTMDQLGKEFSAMSFSAHWWTQMLLTIANGGVAMSGIVPPKQRWAVVGGVSLIQAIVGLINHAGPGDEYDPKGPLLPPSK